MDVCWYGSWHNANFILVSKLCTTDKYALYNLITTVLFRHCMSGSYLLLAHHIQSCVVELTALLAFSAAMQPTSSRKRVSICFDLAVKTVKATGNNKMHMVCNLITRYCYAAVIPWIVWMASGYKLTICANLCI